MLKKESKYLKIFIMILILFIFSPVSIYADQLDFYAIYNEQMKGEIKITGNTLQTPDSNSLNSDEIEKILTGKKLENNNDLFMTHLDVDGDGNTINSSSADLEISPGAKIHRAFLVWGANVTKEKTDVPTVVTESKPPTIEIKTPKMDYKKLKPTHWNQFTKKDNVKYDYTAYVDVTEIVKDGGAGTYTCANIPQGTGAKDVYGGWSLITVFEDKTKPLNDLSIYFGHKIVTSKAPGNLLEIPIQGFKTPDQGEVHAKLGIVTWEGDRKKGNEKCKDSLTFGGKKLSDVLTNEDNFFDSGVTYNEKLIGNRNPAYVNNLGIDAKIFNQDGVLKNSVNSTTLKLESNWEWYYPTIVTTEIELYAPDIKVEKEVKNINGSKIAKFGDILEYTVEVKNQSTDTSINTIASDILPEGIDYVPNTIKVLEESKFVSKTDESGDDNCEYDSSNRKIVLRIGKDSVNTGEVKGGNLSKDEVFIAKFQGKVNEKKLGSVIRNTVKVNFDGSVAKSLEEEGSVEITTEELNSGLTLSKQANKKSNTPLKLGEVITYTFIVKNTGNNTIYNIDISDPLKGLSKISIDKKDLEPGETLTGKANYIVTKKDVSIGKIENIASATGETVKGEKVEASDTLVLGRGETPEPGGTGGHSTGKKHYKVKKNPDISLNRELHYAYMFGYPQGDFRPERPITRAEAAVLFTRLSVETGDPGVSDTKYPDVVQDSWYADAVNYLSHKGIIKGYEDGLFRPNQEISRAEFAAIASRYERYTGDTVKNFPDVDKTHWAMNDINSASSAGWINGYPDGTFKPAQSITRAEVVTIVNRMLYRVCDKEFILSHLKDENLRTFTDLQDLKYWAFFEIMEATNGHDFNRLEDGKNEKWLLLNDKDFYYDKHLKDMKVNKKYYK